MIALPIDEIATVCQKYSVKRMWLFGSAAGGTFDPVSSDIDLLVEFQPGTDLGPWMKTYFDLKDALESLLGRGVDLVERCALRNPYLKEAVEEQEVLLFAA